MFLALSALDSYARSLQRLLLGQAGQYAKDDRHAGVEGDAHEAVRDGVADVLEVHCAALDQDADGDESVEWAC